MRLHKSSLFAYTDSRKIQFLSQTSLASALLNIWRGNYSEFLIWSMKPKRICGIDVATLIQTEYIIYMFIYLSVFSMRWLFSKSSQIKSHKLQRLRVFFFSYKQKRQLQSFVLPTLICTISTTEKYESFWCSLFH